MFSKKLKQLIDDSLVISFDIFDTLIIRSYNKPTDLFKHIEISKSAKNFAKKRMEAEQHARAEAGKKQIEEVTLDEIYTYIKPKFQKFKDIEIAQELLCCSADKNMFDAFEYAKKNNKRVIISSDMYLPQNVVEQILSQNGYNGYEKLFLSSTTKTSKASGNMFKDILTYTKVSASQILHIGDNLLTDNDIPNSMGFKVFHYLKAEDYNGYRNDYRFFKKMEENTQSIPISIFKGLLIKRNQKKHEFWENFGYKYAGLMSLGFCEWLKQQFTDAKIKKAFFMTRDGYIPQKVFNKLYPDFETQYFYASRRCYLFSGMNKLDDIFLYLIDLGTKDCTYQEYWTALSINDPILFSAFKKSFPNQNNKVNCSKLKIFWQENEEQLQKYASIEREVAISYFEQCGLNKNAVATIDIGWRASVQKSIERTLKIADKSYNLIGYYLGTHPHKTEKSKIKGYLLNHGEPFDNAKIIDPILPLLELIYTAPEAGVIKLDKVNNTITPIRQDISINENKRIKISEQICSGVLDFVSDWQHLTSNLPLELSYRDSLSILENFEYCANDETIEKIREISYTTQIGNSSKEEGIISSYNPDKTIGMIYTFPGGESAEKELALRFKKAFDNIGYKLIVINSGHVLDEDTNKTHKIIHDHDLKFVITTHFLDYKLLDTFHYHVVWNPPEIPTVLDGYRAYIDNYISNDDFLIYDDGGMTDHLQSVLIDDPRDLEDASCLVGSFPKSEALKPNLENPRLFYCGMNWDRLYNNAGVGRHSGLFNLLDNSDIIDIYGPLKPKGWSISPWEGYKSYRGEIPFDGFSILKAINDCGVVLACSSDIHRRAGAVTNRVYEACAAGAVIISDDNPFMKKHFGNSVLYIDFNKENPLDTYRQITEKFEWIKAHKEEALAMAQASQKIFIEKFCMEVQLQKVLENHEKRKNAVSKAMYSQKRNETVLAICYFDKPYFSADEEYRLKHIIKQISNQSYSHITLTIVCEKTIESEIREIVTDKVKNLNIIGLEIYNQKHTKIITRGQMLRMALKSQQHTAFCVLQGCEILFKDHFEILKRKLENNSNAAAVHSGLFTESPDGNRYFIIRKQLSHHEIYNMAIRPSGICLFRSEVAQYLPEFVDRNLDGLEIIAFAKRAIFNLNKDVIYSNHVTCGINNSIPSCYSSFLLSDKIQGQFIHGLVHEGYERWLSLHSQVANSAPQIEQKNKNSKNKLKFDLYWNKLRLAFSFTSKRREHIKERIKIINKRINRS